MLVVRLWVELWLVVVVSLEGGVDTAATVCVPGHHRVLVRCPGAGRGTVGGAGAGVGEGHRNPVPPEEWSGGLLGVLAYRYRPPATAHTCTVAHL